MMKRALIAATCAVTLAFATVSTAVADPDEPENEHATLAGYASPVYRGMATGPVYASKVLASWAPVPVGNTSPSTASFDYTKAIRQKITLTSDRDNDGDRKPDTYVVDVVRPNTDKPVPVVLIETPYSGWNMDRMYKLRDVNGIVVGFPNYYDNFLVPYGYAVAILDAPGTGGSGGCSDYYGPTDVGAAQLALDYFAGAIDGSDSVKGNGKATWSNGVVGMVGKSSGGFSALAAASTGHPALKAIIAQSGVANVYTYRHPGGMAYPDEVAGMSPGGVDYRQACRRYNQTLSQAATSDFSDFWKARDHSPTNTWKAPTLLTMGTRDANVMTAESYRDWTNLQTIGIPSQLWLNPYGHDEPFDSDRSIWLEKQLRWWDHYLKGVDNGVDKDPAALMHSSDGKITTYPTWPPSDSKVEWSWSGSTLKPGAGSTQENMVGTVSSGRPVRIASGSLASQLRLNGNVTVQVPVKVTSGKPHLRLTLVSESAGQHFDMDGNSRILVDGRGEDCVGGSTPKDNGCFKRRVPKMKYTTSDPFSVIDVDVAKSKPTDTEEDLPSGQWRTVTVVFAPTDTTIASGASFSLTIEQSPYSSRNGNGGAIEIGEGTLSVG